MAEKVSRLSTVANLARLFFWALLIVIVLSLWFGRSSLDTRRSAVIQKIQKERGSRVITLIHREETVSLFGVPVNRYIDIDDAEAILRAIRLTPAKKPIDLIIHTPGGLVLAASQIAHALRTREGRVTVFVPHYAMSGGTLIALAADEIFMDPNAVLGPVDPQIGDLPAASIVKMVELKKPEHVEDKTLILADMSANKAITQVSSLVTKLLEKHLSKEKAQEVAALLSTGQFTHDFPITVERAKAFGLRVSTEDMPTSIYSLMDLYPQKGVGRPSVNYIPLPRPS
jgi:ClpP class serine protease